MNLTDFSLKNPHAAISLALVVVALGSFAMFNTPSDLFPDSAPPQVVVITVQPGASARDVSDKVTRIVEKELNTLEGIVNVVSTTRDEVSSISAEFSYATPIGQAVLDVQNALGRIRGKLPQDIREPLIYRLTDATHPLLTLAMSPGSGSNKTLSDIRLLAENQIKDELLSLEGVGDVHQFGAHKYEIQVRVYRDRMAANNLSIADLAAVLARQNLSAPAGMIHSDRNEYIVRVNGEFTNLQQIRDLEVKRGGVGFVRISDLADVSLAETEVRSIYKGNGKRAIAVNVLRSENAPVVKTIHTVKEYLGQLRERYPDIEMEIADDQQPIIDLNVQGMRTSLAQAVLITVIVVFLFLADARAAAVVSVSIPLAFLASLVVLWFSPYTMNMVTLTGLIVAVGMVVDASVVVLENIYRHYRGMKNPDAKQAAGSGSKEIALEITAGMLTTVIVLFPVMFAGGYTEQIMRPLIMMILAALIASLLAALTIVPLLASRLQKGGGEKPARYKRYLGFMEAGIKALENWYVSLVQKAMRRRLTTVLSALGLFVLTMIFVMPMLGGELMPPMDTGISIIDFDTPTDYSLQEVEGVLDDVEKMILQQEGIKMLSSVVGSEPGEISFGSGGATAQTARITVHLVDRTQRDKTIWQIQDEWRERLRLIPGVRTYRVSEYGTTPLATTKAPLDIIVSGPDSLVVSRLADESLEALKGVPGLVDVRRSWYFDKSENQVIVDPSLARIYRATPAQVAEELKAAVKGIPASTMRLTNMLDVPITILYAAEDIRHPSQLPEAYVSSGFGPVPLRAMATVEKSRDQPYISREQLQNTIDITGVNRVYTIKQLVGVVNERLQDIEPPQGYSIDVSGTAADMDESQSSMVGMLFIGIVLLYILLVAIFKSFRHPFTIMAAIPLATAGAIWGLLMFNKPMCQPALMGIILLGGTIVNNSILLLGFILKARRDGMAIQEAIVQSVRLRVRPILMTTVSTILGLMPLVLESAVGLERMSPLGIVAAVGLTVGTILTMVVVPVVFSLIESLSERLGHTWRNLLGAAAGSR